MHIEGNLNWPEAVAFIGLVWAIAYVITRGF